MMSLILASSSPRRQELIALLGLPFAIVPSRYDEPRPPDTPLDLAEYVTELAANKAGEVASRTENGIVIGADTLVTASESSWGVPLGKPLDDADAARMLRLLAGRSHLVLTGVALLRVVEGQIVQSLTDAVQTRVWFRLLTESMIARYIATGEPHDKAGAYGAQGWAAPFIERFDGDFFNVVGLPLCRVGQMLETLGVSWGDTPTVTQRS